MVCTNAKFSQFKLRLSWNLKRTGSTSLQSNSFWLKSVSVLRKVMHEHWGFKCDARKALKEKASNSTQTWISPLLTWPVVSLGRVRTEVKHKWKCSAAAQSSAQIAQDSSGNRGWLCTLCREHLSTSETHRKRSISALSCDWARQNKLRTQEQHRTRLRAHVCYALLTVKETTVMDESWSPKRSHCHSHALICHRVKVCFLHEADL